VFPLLESYGWPGNARELRNVIERMAILTQGERLTRDSIPVEIRVQREAGRNRPSRKRANRPSGSTFCARWRNPTGTSPAPRGRWAWSGPICTSGFARWG
jgi:DNA-binding NtrC family response regulator